MDVAFAGQEGEKLELLLLGGGGRGGASDGCGGNRVCVCGLEV